MHNLSMYGHWGYSHERSISISYTHGPLPIIACCKSASYLVSPGMWGPVPMSDLLHTRAGTLEMHLADVMEKEGMHEVQR